MAIADDFETQTDKAAAPPPATEAGAQANTAQH